MSKIVVGSSEFDLTVEKSPIDNRDWIGEAIYHKEVKPPKTLDLRKNLFSIRNQGTQGTCSAQTASCMKEWQEVFDSNLNSYMSPQFIYNNRENQNSSGMFPRDTMKILQKTGVVKEENYTYGKIEKKEEIDPPLLELAKNYVIKSYAQVNTIDGLKTALYLNGPCYIAVPVFNSSVRMWKPNQGETIRGGHAMTVVGYTNEGFIIRNSWGESWGDKGYCIFPYSDWGLQWEIWTTIDEKSYKYKKDERKSKFLLWLSGFFKGFTLLMVLPFGFIGTLVTIALIYGVISKNSEALLGGGVLGGLLLIGFIITGLLNFKKQN